jgi:TolB protein
MDAPENAPINITHTPIDERYPAWSPADDVIAFMSDRSGAFQVHLMDADGLNLEQLTYARDFPNGVTKPPMAWSPDGETLAFSARVDEQVDVYAARRSDGAITQLTRDAAHDWSPTYSPDGSRMAFLSGASDAAQIWVMAPDGSERERITNRRRARFHIVDWSPALPPGPR